MRYLPSWSLSEPFCSTSWSMAVYLSSSSCHPPVCRLAAVISHSPLRLAGLTHLKLLSSTSLQSKVHVEESMYWFVKTRAICWSTVVKAVPSCGGDYLRRQVQELHALMTSLISDFGCILCHVIIVLCIVFVQCLVSTLQMQRHCIHVAFERGC